MIMIIVIAIVIIIMGILCVTELYRSDEVGVYKAQVVLGAVESDHW